LRIPGATTIYSIIDTMIDKGCEIVGLVGKVRIEFLTYNRFLQYFKIICRFPENEITYVPVILNFEN